MWEQTRTQKRMNPTTPTLLMWSTRGKCVLVKDIKAAKELFGKRWSYLNDEEKARFKVGEYNPIYDLGEDLSKKVEEIGGNELIRPRIVTEEIDILWL